MIDTESIRAVIVKGLREYIGVEVIRSNTSKPLPKLPFGSYTITSLLNNRKGTWGRYEDSKDRIPTTQVWSITLNSKDFGECTNLAVATHDYFSKAAIGYLKEYGIVVLSVGAIASRDTFLSVEYEYRMGFDITFGLMNELSYENEVKTDDIEINGRIINSEVIEDV